MLTKEWQTVPE